MASTTIAGWDLADKAAWPIMTSSAVSTGRTPAISMPVVENSIFRSAGLG